MELVILLGFWLKRKIGLELLLEHRQTITKSHLALNDHRGALGALAFGFLKSPPTAARPPRVI